MMGYILQACACLLLIVLTAILSYVVVVVVKLSKDRIREVKDE